MFEPKSEKGHGHHLHDYVGDAMAKFGHFLDFFQSKFSRRFTSNESQPRLKTLFKA